MLDVAAVLDPPLGVRTRVSVENASVSLLLK